MGKIIPNNANLQTKIQLTIENAVTGGIETILIELKDKIADFIEAILDTIAAGAYEILIPIRNQILSDSDIPIFIKNTINDSYNKRNAKSLIGLILTVWSFMQVWQSAIFAPAMRLAEQKADESYRSQFLSPNDLVNALFRGFISPDVVRANLRKNGIKEEEINAFLNAIHPILTAEIAATGIVQSQLTDQEAEAIAIQNGYTPNDFKTLVNIAGEPPGVETSLEMLNRGFMNEAETIQAIKESRLKPKYTEKVLQLREHLPPMSDLITFSVREAFRDDIAGLFGYDDEYPSDIEKYVAQNGFNPDWLKRYWRSHWQLPSPNQAYQMLHRGIITKDELETLLRTADYPKFWRDKLEAISYNTFTRVDVRRMHRIGVLDEQGVLKAYQDSGYDLERAQKLTEFTLKDVKREIKDLNKSEVLNLLELGIIAEGETADRLKKMGYDETEAQELIQTTLLKKKKTIINDETKTVQTKFVKGVITKPEAEAELSSLGYDNLSIESKLELWDAQIKGNFVKPSISQLTGFYLDDIISIDQFQAEIEKEGWIDPYSKYFVMEASIKKSDEQRKLLEQRMREQERLNASKQKNGYRLKIAELDIHIAELKASIAEAELGIYLSSTPEEKDSLKEQILQQKKQIADMQVEKAKLVPSSIPIQPSA